MSSSGSASTRLRMQLNRDAGLKELDKVVMKYGVVNGRPFTFKDHEFQQEIIRDTRSRQSVRKCSQVGLSELMVQKTLALGAVMKHSRAIFTLPTHAQATSFSKDRFDSAIENSDFYDGLMRSANNSASQKKIGSFVLYISGSFGANSAISIPADILIHDEVDFSNQAVLGKMSSRVRHSEIVDERGNRGLRMKFSTPTVHGYGVDDEFEKGHQAYYACKCRNCSNWVVPDFFHDFVVGGFDGAVSELRAIDLLASDLKPEESKILCPECRHDLWSSLCDPERRQWIAKHPDVWDHSYQVYPWDAPKYNPPETIIKQLGDYPLISDFYNFVIGLPYSDSDNSFNVEQSYKERVSDIAHWEYPTNVMRSVMLVAGMDVGKVCHFVLLAVVGKQHHAVYFEELNNTRANPATEQILARVDHFKVNKMCVDAGPDITLVNNLVSARPQISAVVYVRNIRGLLPYEVKGEGEVINADRTKTLSELLSKHNAGEMRYPNRPGIRDEVFRHLGTTKKIREKSNDGDFVERFVKTSPQDHWVHALNYAGIAAMVVGGNGHSGVVGILPGVSKIKVGSGVKDY